MTISTLFPAFVQVAYHTAYASLHLLNIGLRDWTGNPDEDNPLGFGTAWDDNPCSISAQLEELLTILVGQFPTTMSFDRATVFTIAEVNGVARPRASYSPADFDGTDATPGINKAVQKTFTFYDTEFNHFRIQLMDASSNDVWTRDTNFAVSPASDLLLTLSNLGNNWASRKGFRPMTGISILNKVNNKLRRSYGEV